MYLLRFDPPALDFLEKSEKELARRIWTKLQKAKDNPQKYFERLEERTDYKLAVLHNSFGSLRMC